jgi:hypothetical protein
MRNRLGQALALGDERPKMRLKALPTPRPRGAIPNWRSTPTLRVAGFEDEDSLPDEAYGL